MSKSYEPRDIEQRLYATWEAAGYFAPHGEGRGYCLMIPPPNVTGSLHMGHAFQDTIMDALVRYQRMRGRPTLWQPGTDHAGIATQMVVERQLEALGTNREQLGRERFLAAVWEWKARSGGRISEQLRRMGASVDWSRERFTLDDGLSAAVREVFVRLYDDDLIYRGQRLVNWDPHLQTAVSDLEVTAEEEDGFLWHIRYPLADGRGALIVATTRPETLLGDAAVAVHPDDDRYRALIGRDVRLPLTGRDIPVIGDEYVDPSFGSGCVKITPAHDFNDYEVGLRHGLPLTNIFDRTACIALPGSPYHGLSRERARDRIVADLTAQGLLVRTEPHRLKIPRGERTQVVIEPWLTDQWYVRMAPLAAPAIAAVEQGQIRFVPEHWTRTYFEWMHNIRDWCISRQIWWGHRIPAWYDETGAVYVGRSEAEVRTRFGLAATLPLTQDEDVLDTWFSSALWPFSTLGWPATTAALAAFYPTNVLVTGFDIIFFWVARMIMMGLRFTGEVPFHEVYVHGLVLDAKGQKMAKSRGNVIDPIDLIDGISGADLIAKRTSGLMQPSRAREIADATARDYPQGIAAYGTDALRFTFASLATQGRNINFDLGRIDGYRNFCNKLWNAARYVLMNVDAADIDDRPPTYTLGDRWIISRLQETEQVVAQAFSDYRFDLAAQALYSFVWDEYCSWYLEWSKTVLTLGDAAATRTSRRTLVLVLEAALRLLHPLIPFITETLWQQVAPLAGKSGASISIAPYPTANVARIDPQAVVDMQKLMAAITTVRTIRSEMNIAPGVRVPLLIDGADDADGVLLTANRPIIENLARLSALTLLPAGAAAPEAAVGLAGSWKILIPLAGLIDKTAEIGRLTREIDKIVREIERAQAKLARPEFISRAPPSVVAEEHRRLADFGGQRRELEEQRARMVAADDVRA
ncbi:MAG: valine--tRNA ligase [Acidiferrobacter sp.]